MKKRGPETFSEIVKFIDDYREMNSFSPTVREIASGTGFSKSAIERYLSQMREQGVIEYSGNRGHRNIVTKKAQQTMNSINWANLQDSMIACGTPNFAEENIEDYIPLPVALFGNGDFFILTANGDSMIDAGINDGDLVFIRKQNTAETGQIVVALIGDEATLKRYYPEPEKCRIRLHPENKSMDDIFVDNCTVQGVLVGALKMFDNQ